MDRMTVMNRLEALVRAHPHGAMVAGFTVHEAAMSDCVFDLGGVTACIRQDYPATYQLTLQLEGPYALPPDRVRNSLTLSFLTEAEFTVACEELYDLLLCAGPVDETARDRFVAAWKKKNEKKRGEQHA